MNLISRSKADPVSREWKMEEYVYPMQLADISIQPTINYDILYIYTSQPDTFM